MPVRSVLEVCLVVTPPEYRPVDSSDEGVTPPAGHVVSRQGRHHTRLGITF